MNTNQTPLVKMDFPPEMRLIIEEVLNGEYDIPFLDIKKPVIFDIGANVGSFATWALHRWPGSTIYCFEPSPSTFEYLKKNLQPYKNIILNNVAIGDPKRRKLYQGLTFNAQASFFQLGEQTKKYEIVTTVWPSSLPPKCDILKIDTEGCEVEILEGLKLRKFMAILVEYHSEANRRKIDKILKDYVLVGNQIDRPNRGILKYLSKLQLSSLKKQSLKSQNR